MKITSDSGVDFDSEGGWAQSLQSYCKSKGVTLIAFMATHPDGKKEYVLLDPADGRVVYANQSFEAMGCHVDMIALTKEWDSQ